MNSPSMKLVATLVFASSLALKTGLAQTQSGKGPPKTVSVMGCLVKGDEPNTNGVSTLEERRARIEVLIRKLIAGHGEESSVELSQT